MILIHNLQNFAKPTIQKLVLSDRQQANLLAMAVILAKDQEIISQAQ